MDELKADPDSGHIGTHDPFFSSASFDSEAQTTSSSNKNDEHIHERDTSGLDKPTSSVVLSDCKHELSMLKHDYLATDHMELVDPAILTPFVGHDVTVGGSYNSSSEINKTSDCTFGIPDLEAHGCTTSSNDMAREKTSSITDYIQNSETLIQQTDPLNSSLDPDTSAMLGQSRKKRKGSKKSNKMDVKSKLEKSRQSARECRARKKLRYQYLEDLVTNREKAVITLRQELVMFCDVARKLDLGITLTDSEMQFVLQDPKQKSLIHIN